MKKIVLLLLPCFFSAALSAQIEPANYNVGVARFIKFYNENAADSIFKMFNTKMQTALPIEKTKAVAEQLQTQLGNIQTTEFKSINNNQALYKTTFNNGVFALRMSLDAENKMSGLLVQPYQEEKVNTVDASLSENPVTVNATDATLSGSVLTPKNSIGKIPVVLIIAGSGPTDRDGNSGNDLTANSYFLLANALGKADIASLRYDKRGVGKSNSQKSMIQLRFDDYVNDAIAIIKQLKTDPRFSKVIVLGHSEGSLIGMIAAEKEKVDGFISVAGAGDKASKVITEQYKAQPKEVFLAAKAKLDSLDKGLNVVANNDPMFRPSVQPYLMSWMKYNPQTEIKKLKIPVLIVQGTHDLQVTVADAQNLKKAKPNADLGLIDGMNHILKDAPANREQNAATYSNPGLPLDTNFKNAVINFISKNK
ncbi:MAG: alpha/beta fold hydrolase [Janthinobacterium lividum]